MAHTIFISALRSDIACLPEPYTKMQLRTTEKQYVLSGSYAALHTDIAAAFLALNNILIPDAEVFCVILKDGKIAAEVWSPSLSCSSVSVYDPNSGALSAGRISRDKEFSSLPTLSNHPQDVQFPDMLALFLPLVAHCMLPLEKAKEKWNVFIQMFQNGDKNALYGICELVKRAVDTGEIKLEAFAKGEIPMIGITSAKVGAYARGEYLCGKPKLLAGMNSQGFHDVALAEAKKEFSSYTDALHWTPEEEILIPTFPDDYPVPAETLKIARRFLATRNDTRPMAQFMWRGPTSIGKSTGVECLAALLHTPLVRVTCHPNMETQDFLADFVPDTTSFTSVDLPSFEDMELDPSGAYQALTGIFDEDATCQMALEAYGKAMAARSGAPRFKFVQSNYVKALTRGYICEVQEASRIRNPGVLVGLNEYDRPGSVIPLLDGSYQRRCANAIVVFTDNVGYASCRPLDPSVIRRMAFVIDSTELEKEELFRRVQFNTGCDDEQLLEKMYCVFERIQEYCAENDLMSEASISATEFEMWVKCVLLDGQDSVKDSIRECVVNKVTSDPDQQTEIMDGIVSVNLF